MTTNAKQFLKVVLFHSCHTVILSILAIICTCKLGQSVSVYLGFTLKIVGELLYVMNPNIISHSYIFGAKFLSINLYFHM